jgi:phosphatidylglycerophosphatase A
MKNFKNRFIELILTFFYCGRSIIAPGTVGTFFALLFWWFVNDYFVQNHFNIIFQMSFWIFLILIFTVFAILTIKKYQPHNKSAKKSKDIDHKSIVIDEAVGIFIALEILNFFARELYILNPLRFLLFVILSFIIFRILDITKPLIIGVCDRKIKTPIGVMLDDILCGIFTGIFMVLLFEYSKNSSFFELIHC